MECSICYNEITSATGKVELSCSHPFHFSCLTTWFDKQKLEGAHENCPLCRHESNEFEKMPVALDEEDEDDEDDEDDDDWEEEPTEEEIAEQEAAEARAKALFDKLKFFNPIEEVQLYAANKIKACWRGYQDRLLYIELLGNKEDADYGKSVIEENKRILLELQTRQKFLNSIIGLSRTQVKKFAATKIQSLFRKHRIYSVMERGPKHVELKGAWKQIDSMQWQRVIMNPEEDKASTVFLHPLSKLV